MDIEQADNSSVASIINAKPGVESNIKVPTEVIEKKQKKRFLRSEARFHQENQPFGADLNEKVLMSHMMELIVKSSNLLSVVGASGRP